MDKIFLLGFGSAKCGTTWLYEYLSRCDGIDLGPAKEWTTLAAREKYFKRWPDLRRFEEDIGCSQYELNQPGKYESFFSSILEGSRNHVTGDLSPSNIFLDLEDLIEIKNRLESVGFHVKPVICMRDPINRLESRSGWRFMRGERFHWSEMVEIGNIESPWEILPVSTLQVKNSSERVMGDYKTALEKLYSVFSEEDILPLIYEEMFEIETVLRFKEFLNIPNLYSFRMLDQKVNVGKPVHFKESHKEGLKKRYQDIYEYCYEKFPQTEELWYK